MVLFLKGNNNQSHNIASFAKVFKVAIQCFAISYPNSTMWRDSFRRLFANGILWSQCHCPTGVARGPEIFQVVSRRSYTPQPGKKNTYRFCFAMGSYWTSSIVLSWENQDAGTIPCYTL